MNDGKISIKDRTILRRIACKCYEMSQKPEMKLLKRKWIDHHGEGESEPLITVELDTFYDEVVPPMLECEGDLARSLEADLYAGMVNRELFNDDTVVKDYFPVVSYHNFLPFGLEVKKESTSGVGHHFIEQITDLEGDFGLLDDSVFSHNEKAAEERFDIVGDAFGDILPPKIIGCSIAVCLTQDLVHIMSMETLFCSMTDYPDLFKKMMEKLSDDYIELFDYLEEGGYILPTANGERLCNGSYCYNDFLPDAPGKGLRTRDIWGFMDSQETVGISPDMFDEFIFPYYKKVADRFGALSYGCCEPVDVFWDKSIFRFENLKKLSVSPWCNEERIGEKIRGKGIIYFRKPSPNFIGVGDTLDEDGVRKNIRETVRAAKGNKLEISQRDVYTVNKDIDKVKRYVEVIRSEVQKHSCN